MNITQRLVQNHGKPFTENRISWQVTPCNLTDGYHHVGETFYHEDRGYIFHRNVCTYSSIKHHTTQHGTRGTPTGNIAGSDILFQICLHVFVRISCKVCLHRHSALMLKVAYVNTTVKIPTAAILELIWTTVSTDSGPSEMTSPLLSLFLV
jgi:hypothetical protein